MQLDRPAHEAVLERGGLAVEDDASAAARGA